MRILRIALMLGICSISTVAPAQQSNATMKETVDWLQSKAYLITAISGSSLRADIEAKRDSEWKIVLVSPCMLEVRSAGTVPEREVNKDKPDSGSLNSRSIRIHPELNPPADPSTIHIPLASLNPQKLRTAVLQGNIPGSSQGAVQISTTDDKESIAWRGIGTSHNLVTVSIGLPTEEMTKRFSKAIGHAISLCGGRVDKKEPF